ncbi:hypothetical protein OAA86_06590 [Rhodospirillales bacterium]|nr:hypothetical protein [Rhodospirillales bacterium]
MSSIPSNEINDLFVNVDKEHFASAIVGSEVDDGENAALRIVRSFSTEHASVIFDDGLQPKAIRLSEDFEVTSLTVEFQKLWLRNRPLSSKRRIFMERLGLSIDFSILSKITVTPVEGVGSRSPYSTDASTIRKTIYNIFEHYLSKGDAKIGTDNTVQSYLEVLTLYFKSPAQRRLIYMMDKRLDKDGKFRAVNR